PRYAGSSETSTRGSFVRLSTFFTAVTATYKPTITKSDTNAAIRNEPVAIEAAKNGAVKPFQKIAKKMRKRPESSFGGTVSASTSAGSVGRRGRGALSRRGA